MKVTPFIFNWKTKADIAYPVSNHAKTMTKYNDMQAIGLNPIIINSDEKFNWGQPHYNLGESAYFTAQFMQAVETFLAGTGDVMLHVQADATFADWNNLLADAKKWKNKYNWGVYAPNVDYTWYDYSRTNILSIQVPEQNLKVVACTDCTCWMIDRQTIEDFVTRGIDMSPYKMGWGWDILFPALSFLRRKPVLRDYKYTVEHPPGTNYNKEQAETEMQALFNVLPEDLKAMFYYLKTDREEIAKLFGAK